MRGILIFHDSRITIFFWGGEEFSLMRNYATKQIFFHLLRFGRNSKSNSKRVFFICFQTDFDKSGNNNSKTWFQAMPLFDETISFSGTHRACTPFPRQALVSEVRIPRVCPSQVLVYQG